MKDVGEFSLMRAHSYVLFSVKESQLFPSEE